MSEKDHEAEVLEWKLKDKQQRPLALAQVFIALALTVVLYYGGYYHCDFISAPKSDDFMLKLQYTLRCCAFPFALLLFYTIMQVGNKRGGTPAANPLAGKENYVQLEKNILNNTMEQMVLSFLLLLALTTYLLPSEMKFIPIYVLHFLIARILFIVGYKISYNYRGCGIFMSFLANLFVFGLISYFVYTRGLVADVAVVSASAQPQPDVGREEL